LEIVRAADLSKPASLRISSFFGQPGNVMFLLFYDIIEKAIAAQRFPALALLALARKCHEMRGCVTFHDICEGYITLEGGQTRVRSDCPLSANCRHCTLDLK
jgi:hypothetical protein